MTSILKSAKHVYDVDSDLSYVEFTYERYKKSTGYATYTDYINTEPRANWEYIESKKNDILYHNFLNAMVERTLEVRQRMAELILEGIVSYDQPTNTYVRLMHATKILDPSFQPPVINMRCAWQEEFVKKFCKKTLPEVIQMCVDGERLDYFINVLNIIEIE
jgi:hypothetical protein